ncbi:hypothetical protein MUK42_25628 [Musa troglodytarum]|uniref:Uncharacterized protein n=1 Tax=Musa troglodytarum TaxID=320322 RepID=A0A9E7FRR8_9LILI|nr:hypothetical protein MUK42_25628 [Musa troglodytarum]
MEAHFQRTVTLIISHRYSPILTIQNTRFGRLLSHRDVVFDGIEECLPEKKEATGKDDAIGKSDLKQARCGLITSFHASLVCDPNGVLRRRRRRQRRQWWWRKKERLIASLFSVSLPLLEKMTASFSSKLSAGLFVLLVFIVWF